MGFHGFSMHNYGARRRLEHRALVLPHHVHGLPRPAEVRDRRLPARRIRHLELIFDRQTF